MMYAAYAGGSPYLRASVRLSPTHASLTIVGENAIHARHLFSELEQELERHKYEFSWASRLFHRVPEMAFTTPALLVLCWLWLFLVRTLSVAPLTMSRIAEPRIAIEVLVSLLSLLFLSLPVSWILRSRLAKGWISASSFYRSFL